MSTETAVTTLRETARQNVIDSVRECAEKSHERNYSKLHVRREGSVDWNEFNNQSSDIIDDRAEGFQAVPSVACVGTGSCVCNCLHCEEIYDAEAESRAKDDGRTYDKDAKYATREEAIKDAVACDLSDFEEGMLAKFDAIPAGYFDDEDVDETR